MLPDTIQTTEAEWRLRRAARSPLHADGDLASGVVQRVEPALHEQSPLQAEGGDEEVEAHSTEAVALEEGHEEAEAHEDHHVDVLEA